LPATFSGRRRAARWLLAVSIAARLAVAPFTEDPWDLRVWEQTGLRIADGHTPYVQQKLPYAYPPVWAGWCGLAASVGGSARPRLWRLMLKLPLVAADGGLGWALASAGPAGPVAAAVVALAPPFFTVSALWGQFDALPALFTVLALLALARRRAGWAGILLGLASSWKLAYPLLALPWLAACAWRAGGARAAARLVGGAGLVLGAALAPALAFDPRGFLQAMAFHAHRPSQGLVLWPLLAHLVPALDRAGDVVAPLALLLGNLALVRLDRARRAPELEELASGTALLTALFLLTSKVVNEQYVLWLAAPLLLAWAASGRRSTGWLVALVLGMVSVILGLHVLPDLTGIAPGWVRGDHFPLYPLLGWLGVVAWAAHLGVAILLARSLRGQGDGPALGRTTSPTPGLQADRRMTSSGGKTAV